MATSPSTTLRAARVADLLPDVVERASVRRNEATAIVQPGRAEPLDAYLRALADAAHEFAAWDGRVVVLPPDDAPTHRVVILDRYGQVYDLTDAPDGAGLPTAEAVTEWFRFLATACPECGVLDDPVGRGWVP
ncbi:MAG TPA: hypothetical protein VFH63_06435 [candidate division Zixibacteria bacterium]|nr:hypothetical protein [candidate division Zixibacteria bacterium]